MIVRAFARLSSVRGMLTEATATTGTGGDDEHLAG